jgi:hypothetical protein
MEINAKFIKEQFKNITQVYGLEWTLEDEYQLKLENKKVRIYFGTERWDDGIMLSLKNKIKNEFYYTDDIEKNKGFDDFEAPLSQEEKNTLKNLKEGNDKIIFAFRILLEKHCQDVLNGDFSSLGAGKSS